MSGVDIFDDIRRHAGAAGGKFMHENVVLAAVEEILTQQSLDRSAVSYMGALMLSLQSGAGAEPAVYAGVLKLLERALGHVPRGLLLAKAGRIAQVIVAVANTQIEQPAVLKPALGCVQCLLGAQPEGVQPTADALKLFRWLLEFTHHASPKVRQRGQQACIDVLRERGASLSSAAAKFIETRLAAARPKDVQPTLLLLNFAKSALPLLQPAHSGAVVQALVRLLAVSHPVLSRHTTDTLLAAAAAEGSPPLPPAALIGIIDSLLQPRADSKPLEAGALRVCASAACSLAPLDRPACHMRLPLLVTALLKGMWRQMTEPSSGGGGGGSGGGGKGENGGGGGGGGGGADDFSPEAVAELLRCCVTKAMEPSIAAALAATLREHLAHRYLPAWPRTLEACGALFDSLGPAAHPPCSELLAAVSDAYGCQAPGTVPRPGQPKLDSATRAALMSALGHAAKALGPETFLQLLPLRVATNEGSTDTSWLLTILHGHIGHASLAHFASYMLPLAEWLQSRSDELIADEREVEAANLRQLHTQVWALFPGYCTCATDAAVAFGGMARALGAAISAQPEVRLHALQGLTLLVLAQRAHKQPSVLPSGQVSMSLTAEAAAALTTIGSYAKNFMPLLFNTHQAERIEKQAPLQEAVAAIASVAPPELLDSFFKAVLRKLLEAATQAESSCEVKAAAKAATAAAGGAAADMETADEPESAEATQRGLLELLLSMAPSLQAEHVTMLWRAVRPQLQHPDPSLQKKAYKVVASLAEAHPSWARETLTELKAALEQAAVACVPASKRQRLAALQRLLLQLGTEERTATLPALLGEVVLATKEQNVKTRGAAYDLLLALASAAEKSAPGGSEAAKAEAVRGFLVMVAAGVAGNSTHMMSSAVLALARLVYAYRGRESMLETSVQLLQTVCSLLLHKAQEVVRAAITFCKVALSALPLERVQPLLPKLVPPLLTWCSNKHPHLKTQVRYLMERMVKKFGHDAMMEVTPEAHQRMLTHMRKQKVRASNHAAKRILARDGEGGEDTEPRHREFESLLDDDDDGDDDGGGEGEGEGGEGGAAARGGGVRKARRIPRAAGRLGLDGTWQDRGEGGIEVNLLEAPLVEPGRGSTGGARGAAGKRGREDGAAAYSDGVTMDEASGKLVIREDDAPAAGDRAAGGFAGGGKDVEVDAEDEILRPGGANVRMNKRQRALKQQVVPASAAEEAAGGAAGGRKSLSTLRKKRSARFSGAADFGAQLGDQYSSKRGAGDVKREGQANPYAFLPLNPRMLGKRQQLNVKTTLEKFAGKKQMANAGKKARPHVHGIEARRKKSAGGGKKKVGR